jgi:sec-independent protein translocase protein TatA
MLGELQPWHIMIVLGVFVLLFGTRRLPDAARSIGRSMRIMKTEVRALHEDEPSPAPAVEATTANSKKP